MQQLTGQQRKCKSKLMVLVKRTLTKWGYLPDKQAKAIDSVLKQAELIADFFTRDQANAFGGTIVLFFNANIIVKNLKVPIIQRIKRPQLWKEIVRMKKNNEGYISTYPKAGFRIPKTLFPITY